MQGKAPAVPPPHLPRQVPPLPGSGCLASTPPRTEPDTLQLAPPKLNSTIEIRSRPDKQSADERLPVTPPS